MPKSHRDTTGSRYVTRIYHYVTQGTTLNKHENFTVMVNYSIWV